MEDKGFLSCVVMYTCGLILVWAWLFTSKWSVAKLPNYPATAAEDMLGKISRTSRFLQQITKLQIGYLYVSFVAMCFSSIWLKSSNENQIKKKSSLYLIIQPIFDHSYIRDPVTCVIKAVVWTERLNVKTSSFIENRPSLPKLKYKTSSNHMAMWAKLVELHFSRVVSIRQKLFHLNSRAEIAHIPSSRTDNFNLSHENTVHGSVIREAGFSTYIGQLHEAITIPQNAVTPSIRQKRYISEFMWSDSKQDTILVDTRTKEITKLVFSAFLWGEHQNKDLSWMNTYMLEENRSCLLSIQGKHAHISVLYEAVSKQGI